jgi:hypothetical protein
VPARVLCGEEGAGGGEGCDQGRPGESGEKMGRGVGVKGAVLILHGIVGVWGGEGVL